jgi:hypothetical protein
MKLQRGWILDRQGGKEAKSQARGSRQWKGKEARRQGVFLIVYSFGILIPFSYICCKYVLCG